MKTACQGWCHTERPACSGAEGLLSRVPRVQPETRAALGTQPLERAVDPRTRDGARGKRQPSWLTGLSGNPELLGKCLVKFK